MPSKNSIKVYVDDSYYHIYNRGVEKRIIFQDEQDYKVFLSYLKEYLSPVKNHNDLITIVTLQGQSFKAVKRQPKNYHLKVNLLAYCLMPNHYHLLIHQKDKQLIEKFMRSLSTRYSQYFNKKYKRVGPLFQGRYKAVLVKNEEYLLHLSRYIHLNPSEHTDDIIEAFSSYGEYLGKRKTSWISTQLILGLFENNRSAETLKIKSYQKFTEGSDNSYSSLPDNIFLDEDNDGKD